jgi:predicted acetyltransferase
MTKSEQIYQAIQTYKKKFDNLSPMVVKAYIATQKQWKVLELTENNPETTQEQWQKVLDNYEKAYEHYQTLDRLCAVYDSIVGNLEILEENFQNLENILA